MNILHVCANPKPVNESTSKQLAVAFFSSLAEKCPDADVTNVDLYENPPPYVNLDTYRCFWYPITIDGYKPTDKELNLAAYSFEQAEKAKHADVIVLTMPLWNNGAPAILKAWMEHILMPGLLFEHKAGGEPRPLHHIRKVVLLVSSGEALVSEDDPADSLTPQIRASFEAIGIRDIAIAWADGQDSSQYADAEDRKRIAMEMAEELAEEVAEI